MAELRTVIALGAAAAMFAVGGVAAASMSGERADTQTEPAAVDRHLPDAGAYANDWHRQTAIASYQSRLLRYAQQDDRYTGARLAFESRSLILYGVGQPSGVVKRLLRAAPRDVNAMWISVPYSRLELYRAAAQLRRAMPSRSIVDFAPNFSGVLVGLRPMPAAPGRQAALYARAQRITDVPVTFLQAGFSDPT